MNALGLAAMAAAFLIAGMVGTTSIVGLVFAVNLLDFGQQTGQIASQTRIFGSGESLRARLNTIYMVTTFAGGGLGALAGGLAWSAAGWHGVCLLGGGLVALAAVLLASGAFELRSAGASAEVS